MGLHPRILSVATAHPSRRYRQEDTLAFVQRYLLGHDWRDFPERVQRAHLLERAFDSVQIDERQCAIDLEAFYQRRHTTAERMALYLEVAYALGDQALRAALAAAQPTRSASDITDLELVSCTGYAAPGLDVLLARDLGMPRTVRRVIIGHMGCHGALVGLRQSLVTARAYPEATVAIVSVEISSLHLAPTEDAEALIALFGDAAAALVIGQAPDATGPEVVDTFCAAEFASADQMTWTIGDEGFVMGLSSRVPVTLRRTVSGAVEGLLAPHGLRASDITHWMVHPGGPSILTAIQRQLELTDEQMALSWQILRDHGNCSSATVLLILDALLRSGATHRGEWGVMMAFGPGLTLETCLLRF